MSFEKDLEDCRESLTGYVRHLLSKTEVPTDRAEVVLDIVQTVYEKAWNGRHTFDHSRPVDLWLKGIAHNVRSSYFRKERCSPTLSDRTVDAIQEADAHGQPISPVYAGCLIDPAPTPDLLIAAIDALRARTNLAILTAMGSENVLTRRVALLAAANTPFAEISQVTGLSVPAIYIRLHRLRTVLENELPNGFTRAARSKAMAESDPGREGPHSPAAIEPENGLDYGAGRSETVSLGADKKAPRHRRIDHFDDVRGRHEALCVSAA